MSKADDERIRLRANYLNGLSLAVFAVGGLAPLASVIYGTNVAADTLAVVIGTAICFVASYVLHYIADRTLGGLKHDDA